MSLWGGAKSEGREFYFSISCLLVEKNERWGYNIVRNTWRGYNGIKQ